MSRIVIRIKTWCDALELADDWRLAITPTWKLKPSPRSKCPLGARGAFVVVAGVSDAGHFEEGHTVTSGITDPGYNRSHETTDN